MYQKNLFLHNLDWKTLLNNADFDDCARINPDSTLFIFDCQQYDSLKCKSILFDCNRGVIMTNKETKKLVNELVKSLAWSFLEIRTINALKSGKSKALPYVHGKVALIPLTGVTQHSTNWVMFNNVVGHSFNKDSQNLILHFSNFQGEKCKLEVVADKALWNQHLKLAAEHILIQKELYRQESEYFKNIEETHLYRMCKEEADVNNVYMALKTFVDERDRVLIESVINEVYGEKTTTRVVNDVRNLVIRKLKSII